jgi:hypothetical protein
MRSSMMKTSKASVLVLILALLMILSGTADAQEPQPVYESYFNYIGTRPTEAGTNYAGDVQGITHDKNNWFISQTWALWKIPVGLDLAGDIECGVSGVICGRLGNFDEIRAFDHIGDIDYFQYDETTGFLLLPLEGGPKPAIAAFDPVNLDYIAHAELSQHNSASWVAIDPDGWVYTSSNDALGLVYKYQLDWYMLVAYKIVSLRKVDEFQLLDVFGGQIELGPQGGVFSDSGTLLYINNGYYGPYNSHKDGISVFDMQTRRRIAQSTRDTRQPFWYGYDPTCVPPFDSNCEEPEGLTIWNLDDGRAPHISGQLHVLLLDNDISDDVYIRHYTHKIYVDRGYSGEERGKPTQPFNTVGEAYSMAWPGSLLMIKAGSYPESLTLSKRVELHSEGGNVNIGK